MTAEWIAKAEGDFAMVEREGCLECRKINRGDRAAIGCPILPPSFAYRALEWIEGVL
jgi:hypothetical protein